MDPKDVPQAIVRLSADNPQAVIEYCDGVLEIHQLPTGSDTCLAEGHIEYQLGKWQAQRSKELGIPAETLGHLPLMYHGYFTPAGDQLTPSCAFILNDRLVVFSFSGPLMEAKDAIVASSSDLVHLRWGHLPIEIRMKVFLPVVPNVVFLLVSESQTIEHCTRRAEKWVSAQCEVCVVDGCLKGSTEERERG